MTILCYRKRQRTYQILRQASGARVDYADPEYAIVITILRTFVWISERVFRPPKKDFYFLKQDICICSLFYATKLVKWPSANINSLLLIYHPQSKPIALDIDRPSLNKCCTISHPNLHELDMWHRVLDLVEKNKNRHT